MDNTTSIDTTEKTKSVSTPTASSTEATSSEDFEARIDAAVERQTQDIKRDIEHFKITNIEILAVFTALFTFVSIEFRFLSEFSYINFGFFLYSLQDY